MLVDSAPAERAKVVRTVERTGLSYPHLVGTANGREPLTSSDTRDLAAVLGVPERVTARWLVLTAGGCEARVV